MTTPDFTTTFVVDQTPEEVECYTSCTKGWDYYIKDSLFKLLTDGKETPVKIR